MQEYKLFVLNLDQLFEAMANKQLHNYYLYLQLD